MNNLKHKNLKELFYWIPSLYLLEGLPFGLTTGLAVILFKNFNFNNIEIAFYTSLFIIPLFLKPLLAPLMENIISKRAMILLSSSIIAVLIVMLAASLNLVQFFFVSLIIFFLISFVSSIYDMHADGLYIINLSKEAQAYFIGIRTISYQIGRLLSQGFIVFLASTLVTNFGLRLSWQIALCVLAVFVLTITLYHWFALPKSEKKPSINYKPWQHFNEVGKAIFAIPHFMYVAIFIFIFNFAENQIIKIVPLFFLDRIEQGGLQLSTAAVGFLTGGVGIIAMLIGVLLSGFLLAKFNLRKCLLPTTIFLVLTNLSYIYLSLFMIHDVFIISCLIFLAQFAFGLSNGVYLYNLLLCFSHGKYPMSLYAVGTSLMMFSAMIGGALSGYLQYLLGYLGFFIWIELISVMVLLFCWFLIKENKCLE